MQNRYNTMKKNVFLLASVFAAAMLAVSCGTQAEPTYRADGATPAECYSATLTPDGRLLRQSLLLSPELTAEVLRRQVREVIRESK